MDALLLINGRLADVNGRLGRPLRPYNNADGSFARTANVGCYYVSHTIAPQLDGPYTLYEMQSGEDTVLAQSVNPADIHAAIDALT